MTRHYKREIAEKQARAELTVPLLFPIPQMPKKLRPQMRRFVVPGRTARSMTEKIFFSASIVKKHSVVSSNRKSVSEARDKITSLDNSTKLKEDFVVDALSKKGGGDDEVLRVDFRVLEKQELADENNGIVSDAIAPGIHQTQMPRNGGDKENQSGYKSSVTETSVKFFFDVDVLEVANNGRKEVVKRVDESSVPKDLVC